MIKCKVYNGIDREDVWVRTLRGKRVGLVTNPSGVDRELRQTSDILYECGCLTCLFSPEHGVRGDRQAGEAVDFYTDTKTGLPVYSLYGASSHIDAEIMESVDAIAFDIQDVGARFYTYIYTLSFVMEDCAKYGKEVIVFDRLNPLGGEKPQGTVLDRAFASGVGRFPLATRTSMTVGEYAGYINAQEGINCRLTVIPIGGWTRDIHFHETDLVWIPPSPNLPTPDSCFCYIGTCIAEGTNLSEGRGTAHPFEIVGAPYVDAEELASYMESLGFEGVKFRPCHFVPTFSKHSGELCHGVQLHVTDHRKFTPFEVGLFLVDHVRRCYKEFEFTKPPASGKCFIDLLLGTDDFRDGSFDIYAFLEKQKNALSSYEEKIRPYLIY